MRVHSAPWQKRMLSQRSTWINEREEESERQVWYDFWDTKPTFLKSYQAQLYYVHRNAVHHGLVRIANQYPWCSAASFKRTSTSAQDEADLAATKPTRSVFSTIMILSNFHSNRLT